MFDNNFYSFCPSFLTDMFSNLFELVGVDVVVLENFSIEFFPAWFVWSYMLELMIDFIVWLPQFFHKIFSFLLIFILL